MKKYQPSNSTDGVWFEDRYCDRCVKETWNPEDDTGDKCEILNRALLFTINDDEYPGEWQYDKSTEIPTCTAFSTKEIKKDAVSPGQLTF